jgi:osmotically inducible lipoprotein OsmB
MMGVRSVSVSVVALVACLGLAACNSEGGIGGMSSGETAGTGLGAVGGGLIGYAISGGPAGVIIGMAAGGLIGNRLSNALEGGSQQAAAQAAARAAESSTGETVTWRKTNALFQTEASGYATATGPLFTDSTGRTCRYVRETAIANGKTTEDTVKLCRGPSGWVAA